MGPVSPTSPPARPVLEAVPALLIPGALGLLLGAWGERHPLTALLLWVEPLTLALGAYGVLALALSRRGRMAFGLALGLVLMVSGARLGDGEPLEAWEPEELDPNLRGCALSVTPIERPVRVLVWTVSPGQADARALELGRTSPDLVVVTGSADEELAEAIGAGLGGEALTVPADAPEREMILAVRGAFQYCGGEADRWSYDLPGEGGGSRAVVAFPEVAGAGIFPLVAARLSGPGGPGAWGGWPTRMDQGGGVVAGLTRALGARRVVLAGDLHAPRTFSRLVGGLGAIGLSRAETPPSWPAHLGPLPMLPLHTLDQIWVGQSWIPTYGVALSADAGPRAPILVELAPSSRTAER